MKFSDVASAIAGIPYTQPERGKLIYDHILKSGANACLELGFAHGVASCYMAAALDELGEGHLTCVDLDASESREPNLETLLNRLSLSKYVTIHREKNSYNWYLKKAVEAQSQDNRCEPCFDFCFIDGPKNWTIDGFAFFLCDKLLRQEGFILFDDFRWKCSEYSKDAIDGITVRGLSEDQAKEAQIESVFRLCVMQHPCYGNFEIDDDWAWAQKTTEGDRTLLITTRTSLKYRVIKKVRTIAGLP